MKEARAFEEGLPRKNICESYRAKLHCPYSAC